MAMRQYLDNINDLAFCKGKFGEVDDAICCTVLLYARSEGLLIKFKSCCLFS